MGNGSPRRALRTIATLTLAFATVLPAFGKGDAKGEAHAGGRSYDLRTTLGAGAPSMAPAQTRAVERLRAAVPDLLATADPLTGATRTLSNATGFLTGARSGDVELVAVEFALENLELLGLTAQDLDDYEVTDRVPSEQTGVTHLYLRQRHAGLPVYNGQLHFNVAADGRILSVNNLFVPRLAAALNTTVPAIAPESAVTALSKHLGGFDLSGRPTSEPRLMILPTRPGEARLVWNFDIDLDDAWYDVTVDAVDGRLWTRFDWVADATYRVYELPVEAPTFVAPLPPADGRVEVTNPHDTTASPFGWHDTNGVNGAEFTIMRGNNVHAWEDGDGNETPPAVEPDCGAPLDCDFPIDLTQHPDSYEPAAVANLFYWNNVIHDVAYLYGFDSPSGNFQVNTYGQGGVGNDDVRALAQSGAGTNNANFLTPGDGSRPRMRMYLWTAPNPDRDGDLDAGIIAHEYGHGISNRLVGGPANVGCLQNAEQPGEGLSDWWSMFYTFEPANPSVRGIGTYALNQPTTGQGIRGARYDKDPEPNTNPWTYANVNGSSGPHPVGEKWGQAYWYAQGRLEDEHGFDPDVYAYTGTGADAGNIRAMFYVIEGLKNSVCSPGFVDVRNGILQAATASYGGEDVCLLWQAFADYGLGFSASQGSSGSTVDQTPAFDLPPACSVGNAGNDARVCAGTNLVQDILVGPAFSAPVTLSASGNPAPSTVSFNPNPANGPLPQNVQLTLGNTAAAPAGTSTITVTGNDGAPQIIGTFDVTIDTAVPTGPALTAPVNSSSGQPLRPVFTWNAVANAEEYTLEVDDTADFSSPVYTATVTGTSHQAGSDLPASTLLYWRVTGANACGDGAASAVFRFTASQNGASVETCFDVNVPIPDDNPSGVNNLQSVATSALIGDLDVRVVMQPDHTFIGDTVFRISKGATSVDVIDRPGIPGSTFGCSANMDNVVLDDEAATPIENPPGCATTSTVLTGTFQSTNALAAFDGSDTAGDWTLFAADFVGGDTGTIDQWCLIVASPDSMPFLDGFETNDTSRWSAALP